MLRHRMQYLKTLFFLAAVEASPSLHAVTILELWNFAKPEESESRFRAELARALDDNWRLELLTQIARTYSLRRRFEDAHRMLDGVESDLNRAGPKPRVRYLLERGRTFNSAGDRDAARPLFERAWTTAQEAGEEDLAIDAAHMVAIVEGGEGALKWNRDALTLAEKAKDPAARRWVGSLLNNIGDELRSLRRLDAAIGAFRRSLTYYETENKVAEARVARWQIANTLRMLARNQEALTMQLALEQEFLAAGERDGYVYEELGEIYEAAREPVNAERYFRLALEVFEHDLPLAEQERSHLARLRANIERLHPR